jgi:hypothetical protein
METKDRWDVFFALANLIAVVGGLVWAVRRFKVERTHEPRMEFEVDCKLLGPQAGQYVGEVLVKATNRGLIRHEFRKLKVRIRGIEKEATLQHWAGHEPRLHFPEKVAEGDMLFAPKFDYIFVEPGVQQVLTYVTPIPERFRFIVVRAEFVYVNGNSHSTERAFEVPPSAR